MELLALMPSLLWMHSDYWYSMFNGRWGVLLFGAAVVVAHHLRKGTHWSVAALWLVAMISGINASLYSFYVPDAAYSVTTLALMTVFCWMEYQEKLFLRFITAACAVAVAWTFIDPGAYSGNPSMNGTLIAFALPIALWHLRTRPMLWVLLFIFALIAIFWVQASVPVGVFAVTALSYAYAKKEFRVFGSIMVVALLCGIGYAIDPANFLSSTGRFESYVRVLGWIYHSDSWAFGHGLGSYPLIANAVARAENVHVLKTWAHSDWIQILFELGFVGLFAALACAWFTLRKAFRRPWLFAACAGYAAAMMFNFPVHLPVHAFIGAALLWLVWI